MVATFGCFVDTIVATIWQNSTPASYDVPGGSGMKMCSPSDPDVFGKPGTLQPIQLVAHPPRDVEDLRERRARLRIEIDRDLIGFVQRVDRREPRVHRDRRELRHVEQRLQAAADEHRRHVGARHRLDAHAARIDVRRAMLIEGVGRRRRWESAS